MAGGAKSGGPKGGAKAGSGKASNAALQSDEDLMAKNLRRRKNWMEYKKKKHDPLYKG